MALFRCGAGAELFDTADTTIAAGGSSVNLTCKVGDIIVVTTSYQSNQVATSFATATGADEIGFNSNSSAIGGAYIGIKVFRATQTNVTINRATASVCYSVSHIHS